MQAEALLGKTVVANSTFTEHDPAVETGYGRTHVETVDVGIRVHEYLLAPAVVEVVAEELA